MTVEEYIIVQLELSSEALISLMGLVASIPGGHREKTKEIAANWIEKVLQLEKEYKNECD